MVRCCGSPLAPPAAPPTLLGDIRANTAVVAREAMLRRQEARLAELRSRQEALENAAARGGAGDTLRLALGVLVALLAVPAARLLLRLGGRYGALLVLALLVAGVALLLADRRRSRADGEAQAGPLERSAHGRALAEEIAATEERIRALRDQVDRLSQDI